MNFFLALEVATDTTRTFFYENWIIVKQLIWLFGKFMSGIMFVLDKMNIHSIALCIVIFTIVTKMLLLPLTIRQQKSARLNTYISPELQAIQKKYKNKTDSVSLQKMQAEQQAVQEKYGVSMMAGCLPMLIQFPILFALYPVIYNMDKYVDYLATLRTTLTEDQLANMYKLFVIDLSSPPGWKWSWALLIPIFTALAQLVSTQVLMARQQTPEMQDNPMNAGLKSMNYVMPIMLGIFAVTMPAFLGFYWIIQSLVTLAQQLIINRYLDKIPIEEMIRQNIEKANKKRAKRGEPLLNEKATISTRNLSAAPSEEDREAQKREEARREAIRRSTEYYQNKNADPNSLTAKANMVRDYNERNNKK
ncbi:MAG: YidC/Oxa1 family membrane protein insertase [Lachnospiraceae bacterium]|nr:YidC/Oxa1 family membrane protein insertase [Lachnospiraceae bacterium]